MYMNQRDLLENLASWAMDDLVPEDLRALLLKLRDPHEQEWNMSDDATERTQLCNIELETARNMVPTYTRWRHKKGGLYTVLGHDIDTDTGLARVRYKRVGGPEFDRNTEVNVFFSRPLAEWTPDRFTLVA